MKQRFHKSFAVLMAGLLLLTTTSFTVSAHYCMDQLVDVALFEQASTCAMQLQDAEMHQMMEDMGCCDSKQVVSDADKDLQKYQVEYSFQTFDIVATQDRIAQNVPVLFDDASQSFTPEDSPPLFRRHLFILYDSFLI